MNIQDLLAQRGLEHKFVDSSEVSYRQSRTVNGYDFDVAKSALQKYIRRGEGNKALRIASELDLFRWVEGADGLVTNFYNRLRVIMLEDIGMADAYLLLEVAPKLERWRTGEKELSRDLLEVVWSMCLTNHTRSYSHLRAGTKFWNLKTEEKKFGLTSNETLEVQSWASALDDAIHREDLGQAWFWTNKILGVKLKGRYKTDKARSNRSGFLVFEILENACKTDIEKQTIDVCRRWYTTLKVKEQFLCVLHAMTICVLRRNSLLTQRKRIEYEGDILENYDFSLLNNRQDFEDYVLDKHTAIGRQLGRNQIDFAVEGAYVSYETYILGKHWGLNYMTQNVANLAHTESSEFRLKGRAQLTTSEAKTDVYYAENKHGQAVVVKGPYIDYNRATQTLLILSLARLFKGVNTYTASIKLLVPDIFESVPIGLRKKTEKDKAYFFVVLNDLIGQKEYKLKKKSSLLWKDKEVVDYDALERKNVSFAVPSKLSEQGQVSLILQLAFRYMFAVGDMATRNMLAVGDKVYNLDLEGVGVGCNYRLSVSEKQILGATYLRNQSKIRSTLEMWLYEDIWELVNSTLGVDETVYLSNLMELIDDFCGCLNL